MNEEYIGNAIKSCIDSGAVKREDLFIVTKLWKSDFGNVEEAVKASLEKL